MLNSGKVPLVLLVHRECVVVDTMKRRLCLAFNCPKSESFGFESGFITFPDFQHISCTKTVHLPSPIISEQCLIPVVDPTVQQDEAGQTTEVYLEESDHEIQGHVVHQRQDPAPQTLLCHTLKNQPEAAEIYHHLKQIGNSWMRPRQIQL